MGMRTIGIRPYRNQAEEEVGAKGGGSGPAASSHTTTDSNPLSRERGGGGGPNPQLNNSPKLPSPGGTKIRQPNGRQSDAPHELAPNELATNLSRHEIGAAFLHRGQQVSGSISTQPGAEKASGELRGECAR